MTMLLSNRSLKVESDFSETDGDDDDGEVLERDGVTCPVRSWYFVYNSTIKGANFQL